MGSFSTKGNCGEVTKGVPTQVDRKPEKQIDKLLNMSISTSQILKSLKCEGLNAFHGQDRLTPPQTLEHRSDSVVR